MIVGNSIRQLGLVCAAAMLALLPQTQAADAALIDLGFALDESGSVASSDFTLAKQGLANALAQIPTSGTDTYRISVVAFDSGSRTIVAPTVVDATSLPTIQAAVSGISQSAGGTNIAGAVQSLTSLFTGVGLGDTTLFNVTTDGGSSISALQTAATAAATAGVDGLSFEAVGAGADINGMLSVAFPGTPVLVTDASNLPNPTQSGFVFEVASFADYEAAITAKVGRIVNPNPNPNVIPLPAALPLMLAGMGAMGFMGWRRRAA